MIYSNPNPNPGPCALCPRRRSPILATGPTPCKIMLVGEGPARDEDRFNRPFCLEKHTKVLTAELEWTYLKDVTVGMRLMSFDEFPPDGPGVSNFASRRWKVGTVLEVHTSIKPCLEVKTTHGDLVVTRDHLLLTENSFGHKSWNRADRLMSGKYSNPDKLQRRSNLCHLVPVWKRPSTYMEGWIGGFLDGEGHLSYRSAKKTNITVGFSQNKGPTSEYAEQCAKSLGFDFYINGEGRYKDVVCNRYRLRGGFRELLRLLGQTRPNRLLNKFITSFKDGKSPDLRTEPARVLSRLPVGNKSVVDLRMDSGTFIANGFAVHNCGRTGKEVDGQHLPNAQLDRESVYVTNACKCPSPNFKNPKLPVVLSCSQHWLHHEIASVRPEIIVPMGALACAAIGVDIRLNHATPVQTSFGDWSGAVFPIYHPATGLRNADYLIKIQYGFRRLGQFINGEISHPIDSYPHVQYTELFTRDDVDSLWQWHVPTATDTETVGHKLLRMLSFSQYPGTGYVIKPATPAFDAVVGKFSSNLNEIIMHNAPYDLEVYQRAGITIDDRAHRLHDTMQEAYHRMYLPQGLKALAWQLCGMRMQDFNDLVTPHSSAKLLEWLAAAQMELNETCFHWVSHRRKDKITKKLSPPALEWEANRAAFPEYYFRLMTKIGRLMDQWPDFTGKSWLAGSANDDDGDDGESTDDGDNEGVGGGDGGAIDDVSDGVDPWKRISGWNPEDLELLEGLFGKPPVRSIDDAPNDEAVRYSAADSDGTLRVFYHLRRLGK